MYIPLYSALKELVYSNTEIHFIASRIFASLEIGLKYWRKKLTSDRLIISLKCSIVCYLFGQAGASHYGGRGMDLGTMIYN